MEIQINIPNEVGLIYNNNISKIQSKFKLNNALILYKQESLSLEKAATFAEIGVYDFMVECKNNQIPVIDYSEEEIQNELRGIL